MAVVESSLRERSKAKRRAAIQRAAFRLFAERGYEGATIAEIAEEAEVAPRTVTMYFPSKMDIAMSTSSDIAARLAETFRTNPQLSFSAVIEEWLTTENPSPDTELIALAETMFNANPTLRAVSNGQFAEVHVFAGPALLEEIGLPPDDPMVKIVSAAVSGAITEYRSGAGVVVGEGQAEFIRYLRAIIAAARKS